jgi:hypothetical protein
MRNGNILNQMTSTIESIKRLYIFQLHTHKNVKTNYETSACTCKIVTACRKPKLSQYDIIPFLIPRAPVRKDSRENALSVAGAEEEEKLRNNPITERSIYNAPGSIFKNQYLFKIMNSF